MRLIPTDAEIKEFALEMVDENTTYAQAIAIVEALLNITEVPNTEDYL
jgi:hypothetical protein